MGKNFVCRQLAYEVTTAIVGPVSPHRDCQSASRMARDLVAQGFLVRGKGSERTQSPCRVNARTTTAYLDLHEARRKPRAAPPRLFWWRGGGYDRRRRGGADATKIRTKWDRPSPTPR